jgi:hypothetical protein
MKKCVAIVLLLGAVGAAGWYGWRHATARPWHIAIVGPRVSNNDLEICPGVIVASSEIPPVLYGVSRRGPSSRELAYVMLLKLPRTIPHALAPEASAQADIRRARSFLSVTFDRVSFRVTYEIDAQTKSEVVTVCGKDVDLSKGRVFLVDLSGPAATVEQLGVPLPAVSCNLEDDAAQQRDAKAIVTHVRATNERARAFAP